MANLYLDKAGADEVVSKVNQQINALKEAAEAIDSAILGELPNYWQGQSHDKTEMTYQDQYKDFLTQKVPDMVDQLNTFMRECVQAITDVDNQLAGK